MPIDNTIRPGKRWIKPWYKRIFHKHYYLSSRKVFLDTQGQYSEGFIIIKICNQCEKTKSEIYWRHKKAKFHE